MAAREVLAHLGKPTLPPPLAAARGPPLSEIRDPALAELDAQAQPVPDYEFDQRIAW